MARLKRKSAVLETSRRRLAGLKQITPKPNFAPALDEAAYEAEINGFSDDQDAYNGKLAALDDENNRLEDREQRLNTLNTRILAAVKAHFGPDSSEFELIGGVRLSDRKKPVRTPKPKAA